METLDAIFTRRSVRKYSPGGQIPAEALAKMIEAGMCAPSAGDQRPWHFVILNDRAVIGEIVKFHPYAAMVKTAHAAIVVCADTAAEKFKGFWVQDCSAAMMNMLLAAHDMGFGAVWLGIHPMEDRVAGMKKLLRLPDNVIPLAVMPAGACEYDRGPRKTRFDASRVHYNGW